MSTSERPSWSTTKTCEPIYMYSSMTAWMFMFNPWWRLVESHYKDTPDINVNTLLGYIILLVQYYSWVLVNLIFRSGTVSKEEVMAVCNKINVTVSEEELKEIMSKLVQSHDIVSRAYRAAVGLRRLDTPLIVSMHTHTRHGIWICW
jgi:hypothetical protein